ncbi:Uracil-DNA glycosylase, family 4 [hydrothermal vent metagenome]|uniref:Uracil-DNA glycosylase, family 4 n=1 Tax=hydrothermal vent metagenome TaxID=652676 RepID=A0A3B0ZIW7_9ZZZZ
MSQQQQYEAVDVLDAMGITVWQRRNMPLPDAAEVEVKTKNHERADKGELVAFSEISSEDSIDVSQLSWSQLDAAVADCQQCLLHDSKQKSLGFGDLNADVMFITSVVDVVSSPAGYFVGQTEALFNGMLHFLGLRPQQVYVTAVAKCSQNGQPLNESATENCKGHLQRQVALLKPKVIVLLGDSVAQDLQQTKQITDLTDKALFCHGDDRVPLLITPHPERLLQNPLDKRKAWQVFCQLKKSLKA